MPFPYKQWQEVFEADRQWPALDVHFKWNRLQPVDLALEHWNLQAIFTRSIQRQHFPQAYARVQARKLRAAQERARAIEAAKERFDAAEKERELQERVLAAAQERELQARFDAQYQARKLEEQARARAERELEREAARDDGWQARKLGSKRYRPESYKEKVARESACLNETFVLVGAPYCDELARSDLDLLGDLETPVVGGFNNAHARRRALLNRVSLPPRPVSLARVRVAA